MSSSAEPPPQPPTESKQPGSSSEAAPGTSQADATMDTTPDQPAEETWDDIPEDVLNSSTDDILTRARLIDNDIKASLSSQRSVLDYSTQFLCLQVMRSETLRLQHEQSTMKERIRDNGEKIKQNKVLPYLVGNVVEVCLLFERDPQ